jgi:hypothetical protein
VVSAASVDAWVADLGLHLFGRVRRDAVTARELPFVKFGLDAELRPGLSVEIAPDSAGPWVLGLALARVLAVYDHPALVVPSWPRPPAASAAGGASGTPGIALLELHAAELAELTRAPVTLLGGDRAAGDGAPGSEEAGRS